MNRREINRFERRRRNVETRRKVVPNTIINSEHRKKILIKGISLFRRISNKIARGVTNRRDRIRLVKRATNKFKKVRCVTRVENRRLTLVVETIYSITVIGRNRFVFINKGDVRRVEFKLAPNINFLERETTYGRRIIEGLRTRGRIRMKVGTMNIKKWDDIDDNDIDEIYRWSRSVYQYRWYRWHRWYCMIISIISAILVISI